jgi:hypothetical protein
MCSREESQFDSCGCVIEQSKFDSYQIRQNLSFWAKRTGFMKVLQAQISSWCQMEGTSDFINFTITDEKWLI